MNDPWKIRDTRHRNINIHNSQEIHISPFDKIEDICQKIIDHLPKHHNKDQISTFLEHLFDKIWKTQTSSTNADQQHNIKEHSTFLGSLYENMINHSPIGSEHLGMQGDPWDASHPITDHQDLFSQNEFVDQMATYLESLDHNQLEQFIDKANRHFSEAIHHNIEPCDNDNIPHDKMFESSLPDTASENSTSLPPFSEPLQDLLNGTHNADIFPDAHDSHQDIDIHQDMNSDLHLPGHDPHNKP